MAKSAWGKAAEAQSSADAAAGRGEWERAGTLYGTAEKGFRQAEKVAAAETAKEAGRTEGARRAAESAATEAGRARAAAERAGAARFAARPFTAGQQREDEGRRQLERQDFKAAESSFQTATKEYGAALGDLQRMAEEQQKQEQARQEQARQEQQRLALARQKDAEAATASARRAVEVARAKTLSDKEQAARAGAEAFARDTFAAAVAKEAEGDKLAAGTDLGAARQAYQDASERYGEAGRRARVVGEQKTVADQARARMTGEKAKARQDAPEFTQATAQERQGAAAYQRLAFKEAGDSFAAATELFAKAATAAVRPPDPRPVRPNPSDEVRNLIASYARAFEAKDVAQLQRLRPGLKADEIRRLRDSFEQSREYKVSLRVEALDVTGDDAVVKGKREDNLVSKGGQSFRNESSFTYRLKRTGDGWIIDSVN
jgi:hypothetical protein